jgi:hypothetical protein
MAEAIDSILITPAASRFFDNSVPPGHNSSPSFRMKKYRCVRWFSTQKNLMLGGDFAIELS